MLSPHSERRHEQEETMMGVEKCRSTAGRWFPTGLFHCAALVFGSAIVAAPVAAAGPAKPLPPEVRAYFDKARQECRAAGDRLHVQGESDFAETAEFNGDGHPDYIVQKASLLCPALGASEYCGSAGCEIAILVSEGDRLREVADDNYQGFAITRPVGGRQSIVFGAHGTSCGHKSGADTCWGIMSWTPKGFRTVYTHAEPAELKAADAAPSGDDRPDKNPKYDWKLVGSTPGKPGPAIAVSEGASDRAKTVVACADAIPVIVVAFPPGPKAPPTGVPVMIEIGQPGSNQTHADLVLRPVKDKPAYIGPLSRAALTIMQTAGSQDYAMVPEAWTTQDRDYWIDMPWLPLTHFNETAKATLGACATHLR
jgi:hypothetical protein